MLERNNSTASRSLTRLSLLRKQKASGPLVPPIPSGSEDSRGSMVRCCSQSWFGLSSGAQEDWKFPERLRCLETIIELRTDPRFSLNKIAEYLTATPRRRRRLILDQIRPVVYKAGRYGRARSALQRFICDPSRTVEQLKRVAVRLRDRAAEPNLDLFDVQCLKGSARAIEAFVPIAED